MHLDPLDSSRPELGGSHHLPPYNILCSSPLTLHPIDTFSQDSQSEVPKRSRIALPRFWASITSCSDLWLGWGLKQSCSSLWELSNAMPHFSYRHREEVDSRLLGPSFAHNLGCRSKWLMRGHFGHLHFKTFPMTSRKPNARCFDPFNRALNFQESRRIPTSHFWECEVHPHTYPKVRLRKRQTLICVNDLSKKLTNEDTIVP
jgi:hypothetical protein